MHNIPQACLAGGGGRGGSGSGGGGLGGAGGGGLGGGGLSSAGGAGEGLGGLHKHGWQANTPCMLGCQLGCWGAAYFDRVASKHDGCRVAQPQARCKAEPLASVGAWWGRCAQTATAPPQRCRPGGVRLQMAGRAPGCSRRWWQGQQNQSLAGQTTLRQVASLAGRLRGPPHRPGQRRPEQKTAG